MVASGFTRSGPLQSASAIYNREFGELRINAKTAKEKALYCRLLGKHMFGNENLFPTGIKYTLDPLREFEFDALAPGGIEGITDVRMIELWLGDPDDRYGVITIRKVTICLIGLRRKRKTFGWNVALFPQPSRWSSKEERPNWRSRSVHPTSQSTVVEEYPRPSKLGLPSAALLSRSKHQGGRVMSQPWQALEQLNDVATSHLSWRLLLGDAFDSHCGLLLPIKDFGKGSTRS